MEQLDPRRAQADLNQRPLYVHLHRVEPWPVDIGAGHASSEVGADDDGPQSLDTYYALFAVVLPISAFISLSALIWLAVWMGWM